MATPPADAYRVDANLVTWITTDPATGDPVGHYAFVPQPPPAPPVAPPTGSRRSLLVKVVLVLAAALVGIPTAVALLPVGAPAGIAILVFLIVRVFRRRRAAQP